MLSAQAPGADGNSLFLAVGHQFNRLDIGQPRSLGPALGVAHIMPKLNSLATEFTFHSFTFD